MSESWTGHPWATVDHRPLSPTRAACAGCGEICTPHCGCSCCSEPAYEFLLAEARDEAKRYRDLAAWMADSDPDHPLPTGFKPVLPWEVC